jgi:DNA-binding NarL/FixJ family response regulator
MTQEQIEAQYTIAPKQYDVVRDLFQRGLTAWAMAAHLGVSLKAVRSCAKRLALDFQARRHAKSLEPKPRRVKKRKSKAKHSVESRRMLRSLVAARSNKARGMSTTMQTEVRRMYFEECLTAQQIADKLHVTKGAVRSCINRWYDKLPPEAHTRLKHAHGSAVRSGKRNPNAKHPDRPDGMHFELVQP